MSAVVVAAIVMIVVIIIIVVVIIVIVIVIVVTAVRMIVDDLDFSAASVDRNPEIAQDLAGTRVEDDLALTVRAIGHDADTPQKRPLLNDRAVPLFPKLPEDTFYIVLRGSRRGQRKADCNAC